MIMAGLGLLLGFWNYNHVENHVAARLYKIDAKKDSTDDKDH